jgi:adenylosuccinate lyase
MNISPLDHRYSCSERELFESLARYFSEDAAVRSAVYAEAALVRAHLAERGLETAALRKLLMELHTKITPEAVYDEEERTHHFIRALVNVVQRALPPEAAQFVHLGATSADILDSALAWRIKAAMREAVLPLLRALLKKICAITKSEAYTPQVGRTHGQHAVPITLGFAFAGFAARLGKSVQEIEARSKALCGKLSGAVGAYNALTLIYSDCEGFERRFLSEMELEPSEYSTQIVEPEYLLRLLLEINIAFGIIANLADDLRHLQRSEIGEVREGFSTSQVGSSTMPQKRNPWNSEHIKSLWKTFMPRVTTFFLDQISEHQRDLTGSASQRFTGEYITGFAMAAQRMFNVLEGLDFDRGRLAANLDSGSIPGGVLAEPAYIMLAESGIKDAHEIIRKITLNAESLGISFGEALQQDESSFKAIEFELKKRRIIGENEDAGSFFSKPELYRGLAAEKALSIAKKYMQCEA